MYCKFWAGTIQVFDYFFSFSQLIIQRSNHCPFGPVHFKSFDLTIFYFYYLSNKEANTWVVSKGLLVIKNIEKCYQNSCILICNAYSHFTWKKNVNEKLSEHLLVLFNAWKIHGGFWVRNSSPSVNSRYHYHDFL